MLLSEFIIRYAALELRASTSMTRGGGLSLQEVEDVLLKVIWSGFTESRDLEVYEAAVDFVVVLLFAAWDQPGKVWWGDHVPYLAS